jgi:hypothetical protein
MAASLHKADVRERSTRNGHASQTLALSIGSSRKGPSWRHGHRRYGAGDAGSRSRCVLIEKKWGKPLVCNDGVTIAKEFALEDPEENLGAQMLRGAAERTGDAVGDGTTTSTAEAAAPVSPAWTCSATTLP